MTGMEHAIERAARIIRDGDPEGMGYAQAHNIARALDAAGLLAPAPLREEWGVQWGDHDIWGHYRNRDEATVWAGDEGTPVHRWVSDWEEQ